MYKKYRKADNMAEPLQPATVEEVKDEQAIFNECWKLIKDYNNITNSGYLTEWGELMDKARDMAQRNRGTVCEELAERMALAVIFHIEHKAKTREGKAK